MSNLVNGVDSGSSFGYVYDALGRPVARDLDEFGYNARGEVTWARYGTNTLADIYDYDSIGNFISNRCHGAWSRFEANELNEYTSIANANTNLIAYDLDGNLLTNGVWTYGYDSENHLTAVYSNSVMVVRNVFDAFARRVVKTTSEDCISHLYDGWNLCREQRQNASEGFLAFWGKDISGTKTSAGGVGGLIAVQMSHNYFLPLYDASGNITSYIHSDSSVVASYRYDAFGRTIHKEGSMSSLFRFGFSTKLFDSESDLVYYGYRFLNASCGRWLTRDPLGEAGGFHLYAFLSNNSLSSVDYLGLSCYLIKGPYDISPWEGVFSLDMHSAPSGGGLVAIEGVRVTWTRTAKIDCCCKLLGVTYTKTRTLTQTIDKYNSFPGIPIILGFDPARVAPQIPIPTNLPAMIGQVAAEGAARAIEAIVGIYVSELDRQIILNAAKKGRPSDTAPWPTIDGDPCNNRKDRKF